MFDKCVILGLDKRKNLWASLREDCLRRGFDTDVFVVGDGKDTTVQYDHIDAPGYPYEWNFGLGISAQRHYWAFESHKAIIRLAVKKKWDSVLLLEDDCYFVEPRFSLHWPEVLAFAQDAKPDILYLGWHAYEYKNHLFAGQNLIIEEEYHRSGKIDFITIPQCGGLFACIIRRSLFPVILNMPAIAPIDSQLNYCRKQISSYNVIPNMMYPRSCWSSCENTYIERNVL